MEAYISKLNEYKQKTGATVQYEEGSAEGPSHNLTFTCTAIINGTRYLSATGKSKKEAKHNAACNAYTAITETHNTQSITSTQGNLNNMGIAPQINYISLLNEYQQKNNITLKIRESTNMDPGNAQLCTYDCTYVSGDKEYPKAYGKTKKEAKEAAAKCVYEELLTQNTEALDKNCNNTTSANLDRSSFAENSRSTTPILDNNYVAWINHYCQKNKCVLSFNLVERRGPPHNPEFVYKAVINGKEYSEGLGKCKKEAQQHAAQKAWSELQQHSDGSTQSSEEDTSSHASEINKSEEALHPSQSSAAMTSTSDSVVFKDSSAVGSPMAISPAMSPMDVRPKVKLAPSFNQSPIFSPKIKGNTSNMNMQKPTKSSTNQTATQAIKSRFLEDFDSIDRIGKGGFGRVFKARRKLENKFFAVKIVRSTEKALREVGALANLHHPNIVRYNTTWEEDTTYRHDSSESTSDSGSSMDTKYLYIQMELCEGDTLRGWIEKRNSLNEDNITERRREAEHICSQILHAVKCIHSKDLIHRDLKPANIMFGSEGGVKVGDFGLVTAAENDSDELLLERTRRTGTRSYMSPEQLTPSYDRKVDIFALGLIYFELLWKLVTGTERIMTWDDIRSRKFPPQFSIKFDFEHNLINNMLDPNPKKRPDASELILELQHNSTVLKNN